MARQYFDVTLRKRFNPLNEPPVVIEHVYAVRSRSDNRGVVWKSYETPYSIITVCADDYDDSFVARKYGLI